MITLFQTKKLEAGIFCPGALTFEDDVALHAKWAYDNIYSKPYPNERYKIKIARAIHGLQHVSRVAIYVPILVNLFRRHNSAAAMELTNEKVKFLQIAALFHDSAREDEGEDFWDHESGILLFLYLTQNLGVDKSIAKMFAEAIANKDAKEDYKELIETETGDLDWKTCPPREKNIYQQIIHDADCLDIIRARAHFDANYLIFYQTIAKTNVIAFEEMAAIIQEARSLIELHGDSYARNKIHIKQQYERSDGYSVILATVSNYKFLSFLYGGGKLLSAASLKFKLLKEYKFYSEAKLTDDNLKAAFNSGILLARGIANPSALRKKVHASDSKEIKTDKAGSETLIQVELRKMLRRPGVPTRSGSTIKFGNYARSCCFVVPGATAFASVGLVKVNFDLDDISSISSVDANTGKGKYKVNMHPEKTPRKEKEYQITQLWHKIKMGGDSRSELLSDPISFHSEIEYHIKDAELVYFTQDPCFANINNDTKSKSYYPPHRYSAPLQAIYIQNECYLQRNFLPPIVEYSGIHNFMVNTHFSRDEIRKMWIEMCGDYIHRNINLNCATFIELCQSSVQDIKVLAMYDTKHTSHAETIIAADDNYEKLYGQEFQRSIDNEIEANRKVIIDYYLRIAEKNLISSPDKLLEDEILCPIVVFPEVFAKPNILPLIINQINKFIDSKKIFLENRAPSIYADIVRIDGVLQLSPKCENVINQLKFNCNHYEQFIELRCYILAKTINEIMMVEKLKKLAIDYAEKYLKKFENSTHNVHFYQVNYLINFIFVFDIQHKLLPKIQLLIAGLMAEIVKQIKDYDDTFKLLMAYVNGLQKLGWLYPQFILLIKECTNLMGKNLRTYSPTQWNYFRYKDISLENYIELARIAHVSKEEQISVLCEYFSKDNNWFNSVKINDFLKQCGDLLLNKKLFKGLLSSIRDKYRLDDLIQDLPEKALDWQLELINERKVQIFMQRRYLLETDAFFNADSTKLLSLTKQTLFGASPTKIPLWITTPAKSMGMDPQFLYDLNGRDVERYSLIINCRCYLTNHHAKEYPHAAMTLTEVINETNEQQSQNLSMAYPLVKYQLMTKEEAKVLTAQEIIIIAEILPNIMAEDVTIESAQAQRAALDAYRANLTQTVTVRMSR